MPTARLTHLMVFDSGHQGEISLALSTIGTMDPNSLASSGMEDRRPERLVGTLGLLCKWRTRKQVFGVN